MESSMIQLQWDLPHRGVNRLIDLQNENGRFRGTMRNDTSRGMVDNTLPIMHRWRWTDS